MSRIIALFCGTTFLILYGIFKEQLQCLQALRKCYPEATVEEKVNENLSFPTVNNLVAGIFRVKM